MKGRKRRQIEVEDEYEEGSSSSSSSGDDLDRFPQYEFTWETRKDYLLTQLKLMKKLQTTAALSSDPTFKLYIEVKVQNMYRQVECLLESEFPEPTIKDLRLELAPRFGGPTTITKRIEQRGEDVDDYDLRSVGQSASYIYRRKYGRKPRKVMRYIRDRPTIVNEYLDVDVIDEALDENQ